MTSVKILELPLAEIAILYGLEIGNGGVDRLRTTADHEVKATAPLHKLTIPMIDPHGVTDNLRWKTVSVVTRSRISHELSLSISSQVDNTGALADDRSIRFLHRT
jgi:hypothetical protein